MLTLAADVPLAEWHEQPELWLYFPAEFPSVNGTTESRSKLTNKMGRRTDCMSFGSSQCMRVLWYGDWTRSGLNEVYSKSESDACCVFLAFTSSFTSLRGSAFGVHA